MGSPPEEVDSQGTEISKAVWSEPRPARPFPIVGIGASAGGIQALESLVARLRGDNMAFVVVLHLAPEHESLLPEVIARCSKLTVLKAESGLLVERNQVYVIPPARYLTVSQGRLQLHDAEAPSGPRLTIDFFLRSLALDQGPLAVAVILSGTGTDGTLGLKEVKVAGGITFVQEPSTAQHDQMPRHALDSGFADFSLSPEQIGDELMRIGEHPYVAATRAPKFSSPEVLSQILGLLKSIFHLDFSQYKPSTLGRRLERRMALNRIDHPEDYFRFVESNRQELGALYRDLLINITSYFRDREPFEALKDAIFPAMMQDKHPSSPIRIWVPACSSGEEPFSVAMCLLEFLGDGGSERKVQIFATDVDEEAIQVARLGLYPENIALDVSAARLQRFFSHRDKRYQVNKQIRDMVVFATHDLTREPPFSRLDLIVCRNLLIYLQPTMQQRVLRVFHYALNPGAFLLLGNSETVGDSSGLFNLIDRRLKLYTKRNTPLSAAFELQVASHGFGERPRALPAPRAHRSTPSIQQLADKKILDWYAPHGVLINENLDVLQYRGQTSDFLVQGPGAPSQSLLKLARPELLIPIRRLVKQTLETNAPISSEAIRLRLPQGERKVTLDAIPVQEAQTKARCVLIVFHAEPLTQAAIAPIAGPAVPSDHLTELERELEDTKDYLQTVIEEMEASNEELQSSNEELQSSNEELQSTNEELQTSKEELQSTNEELATVNDELHDRMLELNQFKDNFYNLMDAVETPVVLVGLDLKVRAFTPPAQALLGLSDADLGRPVAHVVARPGGAALEKVVSEVIATVRPREEPFVGDDGRNYACRVQPFKTTDHRIAGAVISYWAQPKPRKRKS